MHAPFCPPLKAIALKPIIVSHVLVLTNANYFFYSKLIRKSIARVLTVYNQTQKVHFAATHVCSRLFLLSVFSCRVRIGICMLLGAAGSR